MNVLKQILLRALYIYLAIHAFVFFFIAVVYIMNKNPVGSVQYSGDPFRGYFFCVLVSGIVQLFKKPNQSPKRQFQSEYDAKYRRLLNMVGGNKQVCDSLISAYGVDRAIEDLIRDRQ